MNVCPAAWKGATWCRIFQRVPPCTPSKALCSTIIPTLTAASTGGGRYTSPASATMLQPKAQKTTRMTTL